jgi:hippurate hydrolase
MPADTAVLADVYRDLHAHPELSFHENRTAALVADRLTVLGYEVTTGVGRTGVVGVLRNGEGPTALLRADMDALPVLEKTELPYASTVRGTDPDGLEVPVMHACGHDMHVTCLLGAAEDLAGDKTGWRGTVVLVFQPAEEVGGGALRMVEDGLFERFPRPDVVLGQHVGPMPAGLVGIHAGPAFAAADALRVTLYGRGGHGSRPEAAVDPIVLAAATVLRLQTVISRDIAGTDSAVITVGALRAGTKANIIPDEAELLLSVRSFDEAVRDTVLAGIRRVVAAEAAASGAPEPPLVEVLESFPLLVNDHDAAARTRAALGARFDPAFVIDPGVVTGSEDVGMLGTAAGVPTSYWLLGGADSSHFAGATSVEEMSSIVRSLPANHSSLFQPVIEPTISTGIAALVAAAQAWLPAA